MEVLEKFTTIGAVQDVVGVAEKAATGFGNTVIGFVFVAWHPPKSLIRVTVYVPGVLYVFIGLMAEDVVPSPKVHEALSGAGEEVLEKVNALPEHIFTGKVKSAITEPIIIEFERITVSVQPVEFVTISWTE